MAIKDLKRSTRSNANSIVPNDRIEVAGDFSVQSNVQSGPNAEGPRSNATHSQRATDTLANV